jgi:hypothetical protein
MTLRCEAVVNAAPRFAIAAAGGIQRRGRDRRSVAIMRPKEIL